MNDLARLGRYDVGLINRHIDSTTAEVWWAVDVDFEKALVAVTELLVLKEKYPSSDGKTGAYDGEIHIRPSRPIATPQYHGIKCEADSNDSSSSGHRHLQSVGGDVSSADGTSYGYNKVQNAAWLAEQEDYRRSPQYKHALTEDWRTEAVGPYVWTAKDSAIEQLIDSQGDAMPGECCGCIAALHSMISPYACTNCGCTKWDSGE